MEKPTPPPIRKINEDPDIKGFLRLVIIFFKTTADLFPSILALISYVQGKSEGTVMFFLVLQVISYLRQIKDRLK